jgi:putative acetyltransferase
LIIKVISVEGTDMVLAHAPRQAWQTANVLGKIARRGLYTGGRGAARKPRRGAKDVEIKLDDLSGPEIRSLIAYHLVQARANSPPGLSFALDLSGLQVPEISFWSVWDGKALMGCGALKDLGDGTGEIKSMRTAPEHLRKGVAEALVTHIIATAKARGYSRLSLETGSEEAYGPALALYRKLGFTLGEPFADYKASAFNQCMHLAL